MTEKKCSIKKLSIKKIKVSKNIKLSNHNHNDNKFEVDENGNITNHGNIKCKKNIYASNLPKNAPTGPTGPRGSKGPNGLIGPPGPDGYEINGPIINTNLSYTISPQITGTNYVILNDIDDYDIYQFNLSSLCTIILPLISLLPNQMRLYKFYNLANSSGTVLILANSDNTIGGSLFIPLSSGHGVQLISDTNNTWLVIGGI